MTRLKSLELQGYKTFASKAVFEFPSDITAIVGPNGSGKSNIADAIRWVLGEQAYSILRGKKTEDMIFTGSELRPRAGMAMASITFDNNDGWLPIDFSEVVISRRAYRDGENEYLLNNQKVRLKEINELLSQTGLSERTYTIIGQGLVDAALSLKPDERRKFFEEAAGIGLYQSRRDESINRLEATKRNLERVNDIISELGPRVNSLERQAKKVQEYERIRSDLRMMLRDWYGFQWKKCNEEILAAATILKEREKSLEKARDNTQQIEENYRNFHKQMQSLRDQLFSINQKLSQLHIDRESKTRDLAVLEERLLGTKTRQHDFETQIVRTREEEDSTRLSISTLDNELNAISKEVADVLHEKDHTKADLDAKNKERVEIEEGIKKLDQQRVNLRTQKIEIEIRREHLFQTVKEIKETCLNLRNQNEENGNKLAGLQTKHLGNQASTISLEHRIEKIQNEILQSEQNLQTHLIHLNEHQNQQGSQTNKLETLHQRKKFYENAMTQMIGASDGAKNIIELLHKKSTQGVTGFLHQHLKVPEKFEKAVNSALLDSINTVILDQETIMADILPSIPRDTNQYTYLYKALDINVKLYNQTKHDYRYPRLLDEISYPLAIKELLNSLLGHYYFVGDDVKVLDALKELPEGSACVTEGGDIYLSNGMVIISGDGRQSGITFTREIEEANKQILETEVENENLFKKICEKQELVKNLKNLIVELNDQITSLQTDLSTHQKIEVDFQNESEQITGKVHWNEEQLISYDEKLEKIQIEIESINKALINLQNMESELESKILLERKKLDLEPVDSLIRILNEKEQVFQKVNQRSEILNTQKEEKLHQSTILQQRISLLNEQKKSNEAEIIAINHNLKHMSEIIKEIKEELEKSQASAQPLENEISVKEKQNQTYIDNLGSARQSLTIAERYFSQAQLEHSRQKDKLDNLRGRIEDDFGLVAFTYAEEIEGPSPLPFEGLVEQLPNLTLIPENLEESILRQRAVLRRIGPINQEADKEYRESKQRLDFLNEQIKDLIKADEDLRKVIDELDVLIRSEFKKTFEAVAKEFHSIFGQLFVGGSARLFLSESDDPNLLGVDIEAKLPGRREQGLSLLSGGERSLTATALIFALLRVSPTPFCVLDEVDAMLDESNVGRFCDLLKELSSKTQFIVITHNRNTVQAADVIYGVTMGRDSASQLIGLRLDELSDEMIESS